VECRPALTIEGKLVKGVKMEEAEAAITVELERLKTEEHL
jgi:hypothetical protein